MTVAASSGDHAGVVAAGSPLATKTGVDVLRSGGNAIDAVIAAALVQSVVEIPAGGVGGDAFLLLRTSDGQVLAINGGGASPVGLADHLAEGDAVPRFGPLSVAVPGFLGAVEAAHEAAGSVPFSELFEPAIALAVNGFEVSSELSAAIDRVRPSLTADSALLAMFEHNQVQAGGLLRRPRLAETLANVASAGSAVFYGEIGAGIVGRLAERGGALSPADLCSYSVAPIPPVSADYGELRVMTNPPVSLGCVLLQELAIYDLLRVPYRPPTEPSRIDAMVRCKLAAFADSISVIRDPDLGDPNVERLLDGDRLERRAEGLLNATLAELKISDRGLDGPETTCVVAADGEGNVAALIHSLFNEFGSRELDEPTGVLLNDRLGNQLLKIDGLGGVAPGFRPVHTLNAVLVLRNGVPEMMAATPGGRGQVQTLFQVLVNTFDGGVDPQTAIDLPRWLSGAPRRPEPNDQLYLEPGVTPDVVDRLRGLGHRVTVTDEDAVDLYGSCIAVGLTQTGELFAAADKRREATAASTWDLTGPEDDKT